jgi:hypothetical protein
MFLWTSSLGLWKDFRSGELLSVPCMHVHVHHTFRWPWLACNLHLACLCCSVFLVHARRASCITHFAALLAPCTCCLAIALLVHIAYRVAHGGPCSSASVHCYLDQRCLAVWPCGIVSGSSDHGLQSVCLSTSTRAHLNGFPLGASCMCGMWQAWHAHVLYDASSGQHYQQWPATLAKLGLHLSALKPRIQLRR